MTEEKDSRPIRLNSCRLCDRVRVVGKRGWMSEAEFHETYKHDVRRIRGEIVRRDPGYCDVHGKEHRADETFESGDAVYEDGPADNNSGLEGQF